MKQALHHTLIAVILSCCVLPAITSCSDSDIENPIDNNPTEQTDTPPLIIFDTDIGSSTDDLFALQMLHRYQDEGRCRLLGVVVDRVGEDCAACADVMNTFYGHGNVPIGLARDGINAPKIFYDYRNLHSLTTANGKPMFATTISDYSKVPEDWKLYRQLLAAQPDQSVCICAVGFLTSLALLLETQPDDLSPLSGIELVRKKVKCLYLMAGIFTSSEEPDYNIVQGISYAQTFFSLWPKDVNIMFSPMEVGNEILYPSEQVVSDFSQTDLHPIKHIYENFQVFPSQKMWDPLTVIQAVEGDGRFSLSARGTTSLTEQGAVIFTPSANGNCRYQTPGSEAWKAAIVQTIRKYNMINFPTIQ